MLSIPEAEWFNQLDRSYPAGIPAHGEVRALLIEMRAVQVAFAREMEVHDQRILHAVADEADTEFKLYKELTNYYRQKKEADPFDPELPKMEAALEKISVDFPPIDD